MALQTSFENPVPVSTFTELVGDWIERLGAIWVEGQLTQISRRPGAGWVYLTLRDPSKDVSVEVTCAARDYEKVVPALSEGARVVVRGKPNFYKQRGKFALMAQEFRLVGVGELLARLEELKRRLAAEGLFDARRKQRLPFLPRLVGLVCGRASAAERDVLENAQRRWPGVRFEVREVAVQGAGSAAQVAAALAELDANPEVDVIVIARGGGSVEDLLPFSDEHLIRAVAACRTPVVSAIGHEPDSPLLDLVADLRASTPTDAAKRIVPDVLDELRLMGQARERLWRAVTKQVLEAQRDLTALRSRPVLAAPHALLDQRAREVADLRDRGFRSVDQRVVRDAAVLGQTLARVRALSPLATLERGYAVVQRADGAVVRGPDEVAAGDALAVRLAGGGLTVTVAGAGAGVAEAVAGVAEAGVAETAAEAEVDVEVDVEAEAETPAAAPKPARKTARKAAPPTPPKTVAAKTGSATAGKAPAKSASKSASKSSAPAKPATPPKPATATVSDSSTG